MYNVKKDGRYYALHRDGELKEFENYTKLLDWLQYLDNRLGNYRLRYLDSIYGRSTHLEMVGHNFNDTYRDWTGEDYKVAKFKVLYIIYDSCFAVVSKESLLAALDKHERSTYPRWRRYGSLKVEFRKDPVPFTGNGSWKFGCWYKTGIDCMQEKKAAEAAQQMGIRVRGSRTKNYLPNSWDDCQRGDCRIRRSWKKRKKQKQWM